MAINIPIALGAASLAGGLLSARRTKVPKPQQIDITQELAMIGELYNQARTQQQELGARQLAQGLTQTSESLAGRGIYRSPVSQRAIGDTRRTYAMALSDALARLSSEEMAKRAELSAAARQFNASQVNAYNQQRAAQQSANRAMLTSGLTSLGTGLLMQGFTAPSAVSQVQSQPSLDMGAGLNVSGYNNISDALMPNNLMRARLLAGLK